MVTHITNLILLISFLLIFTFIIIKKQKDLKEPYIISLLIILFITGVDVYLNSTRIFIFSIIVFCLFLLFYFDKGYVLDKRNVFCSILYNKGIAFISVIFLCLSVFFYKFPIHSLQLIPFYVDYPAFYGASLKQIEIIKQGSLFGWDSSLLGGFFTASDVSANKGLFLLPFLIFGRNLGFHLLFLFCYCLYPFLMYVLTRKITENSESAILSLWFSGAFCFTFIEIILDVGVLSWLIGINLFILNLIFFHNLNRKKPFSIFFLTLFLSLSLYAHMIFFILTVLYFFIYLFLQFDKSLFLKLILIFLFVFLITFNFWYYFIYTPGYIQLDILHYSKPFLPLKNIFPEIFKGFVFLFTFLAWTAGEHEFKYFGLSLTLLPILLLICWQQTKSLKPYLFIIFIILAGNIITCYLFILFFSRQLALLPILLTLVLSNWLVKIKKQNFFIIGLILILFLIVRQASLGRPILHIKDLKDYNKHLIEKIQNLDSLILFENILFHKTKTPLNVQFTHLLTLGTAKSFFATTADGFHSSVYRGNCIASGTFRGVYLHQIDIRYMNEVFQKWGIKYLVLWSDTAVEYFNRFPQFYKTIWTDGNWHIFEFKAADTRPLVIAQGRGEVIDKDYFEKIVKLYAARKGDLVTIRSNYFPEWKGYFEGRDIDILNNDGQLAFKVPASGNSVIHLKFPKHTSHYLMALLAILLSFSYSFHKKL